MLCLEVVLDPCQARDTIHITFLEVFSFNSPSGSRSRSGTFDVVVSIVETYACESRLRRRQNVHVVVMGSIESRRHIPTPFQLQGQGVMRQLS